MKTPRKNSRPARTTAQDVPPANSGATAAEAWTGLPWWALPALALIAFAAYLPALRGPFVFDDLDLEPLREGTRSKLDFYLRSVRPIFYASLYIEHSIYGANPLPYHLTNLVLHLGSAWLLYWILRRLALFAALERRTASLGAIFGSALFLLHPINTEAVSYISSRSEALSIFFGFAAYAVFLCARARGISYLQAAAVMLLLLLAAASKEHVVALVPLMIVTDLFFDGFAGLKRNAKLHAPVLVLGVAAVAYFLKTIGGVSAGLGYSGGTPLEYSATQCRAIWHYVRLFVLPWPQNLDHYFVWSKSLFDPMALLGLAALIAVTVCALLRRKQAPLAAFGWLAFLILLGPTSSFVPIADALVERRLYLPMIGLLLLVMQILAVRRIPTAALCCVLAVLTLMTWNRNGAYQDPVVMWSDSIAANNANPRAHFQLAQLLHLRNDCREAEPHFARAAALGMTTTPLLVNWALTLDCLGRSDEAVKTLQRAAMQDGAHFAYANLAMVEGKRGNYEAALAAADKSIALKPNFDMAWFYRGNVLLASSRKNEAAEAYRKAIALNPANHDARRMLALAESP